MKLFVFIITSMVRIVGNPGLLKKEKGNIDIQKKKIKIEGLEGLRKIEIFRKSRIKYCEGTLSGAAARTGSYK